MDWALKDIILPVAGIFAGCFGVSFGTSLASGLRNRVSEMSLSRSGMQIHTNDVRVWSGIVDTIKQIDDETCKSIRTGTTRLMILNPEKHGMSAEVMLVNIEANSPLIYAAYENHHTRKLADGGGEVYIENKAGEVCAALRIWQKRFPELTDDFIDRYARLWVKKVLIPNLRKACSAKVTFYSKQIRQDDMSKTITDLVMMCLDKNEHYIECIDALAVCPNLQEQSTLFYQTS